MGSGVVEVVVHIDLELGLRLSKELPAGATVGELRAALALDDPTGRTRAKDVGLAALPREGGDPVPLEDSWEVAGLGLELLLLGSADEPPPPEPAGAASPADAASCGESGTCWSAEEWRAWEQAAETAEGGGAGAAGAAADAGGYDEFGTWWTAEQWRAWEQSAGAEMAAEGGWNRSRGRFAAASSQKSEERAACHAVDGSSGTRWTSLYEDGQWLAVDLGAVYPLMRVEIQWEAACAAEYLVEGSMDGQMWTTLASETGRPGWVATRLPVGCEARWVRMYGKTRATQFGFSIYSFDVYTLEEGEPPEEPDAEAERAASVALAEGLEPVVSHDSEGRVVLSLQAALMLQEELKQGFRREVFQDDLNDLERKYTRGSREFMRERSRLFLGVQAAVLPRYGFPGDAKGVFQMMRAFGAPLLQESEAFQRKGRELNELLHMDAGDERREAVALGTKGPVSAEEEAAAVAAAEEAARKESLREALATPAQVVEYRVMQRALVKRLGKDPGATEAAMKLTRQVGSTVFTTGRTWRGRKGGEWVELDPITEKAGWLLVEGPGFGVPGPLLRRVQPGEEPPMMLHVEKPVEVKDLDNVEYRHFLLPKSAKVKEAKEWIALIFGLEPSKLIVARPGHAEASDVYKENFITSCAGLLSDDESMAEAGFQDGSEVHYVFTGDLRKTYEGKEPSWAGKLGAKALPEPKAKAKKELPAPRMHSGLEDHFLALDLDPSTPAGGIKRHYRKLALECHPDKHPDDVEGATKKFQKMKAAYEAIRERLQF